MLKKLNDDVITDDDGNEQPPENHWLHAYYTGIAAALY